MAWEKRDVAGFQQFRETRRGRWRFYVAGFGDTTCRVLRTDGSYQQVPIDGNNRIRIAGRLYGRCDWMH